MPLELGTWLYQHNIKHTTVIWEGTHVRTCVIVIVIFYIILFHNPECMFGRNTYVQMFTYMI